MNLNVSDYEGVTIVKIPVERLDASNSKQFKKEMEPVLRANNRIVLDLTAVRFMDSSGLGAVLSSLRTATAAGGDLKLCSMRDSVRALYELVRMHRIFDIVPTPEDAVRAFQTVS